ncbi:hypothetical protein mvi_17150 [Methylobacterium indicum]|uniref:Uncharacterized protein n=1 Tax=Methylobacterium indicum TaxID=1775910 RepID=A0A8H8WRZ5_9HYPH|nr:hypothetical protein mvi_17150 [Methylobacterium indicum]
MAKREPSMIRTAVVSEGGQPETGPSGVAAQSRARRRAPISPPPGKGVSCEGSALPGMGIVQHALAMARAPRTVKNQT